MYDDAHISVYVAGLGADHLGEAAAAPRAARLAAQRSGRHALLKLDRVCKNIIKTTLCLILNVVLLTSPPPPGLEVRDVHLDGRHIELLLAGVGGGRHQAEGVGHIQVLVCSKAEVSRVELSTKVKRRFVKISRSRRRVLLVESATLMQWS